MKRDTPTPLKIEQLFQDLEDGSIAADDYLRLMDLLRHQPELRLIYLEHMAFVTGLDGLAKAWGREREPENLVSFEMPGPRSRRRQSYAAVAAVLLLAAIIGAALFYPAAEPRAAVVAGRDTKWRFETGGIAKEGDFTPDTRVSVDHGLVEITTRSQSKILLEGPAVLEISDRMHARLVSGRSMFSVAPGDKGFTVMTERLRLVDLGTRFGVAISPGSEQAQVVSGHVQLYSRVTDGPPINLRTGEAVRSEGDGKMKIATYDPGLFMKQLAEPPAEIHWSFDEQVNGDFSSSSHGLHAATMRVVGVRSQPVAAHTVPGRFGAALDLTAGDSFAESDFPGLAGTTPRTVSLWMKSKPLPRRFNADGDPHAPSLLSWGDLRSPGGSWHFQVQCLTGVIGTEWGVHCWMTGGDNRSRTIFDDGWHHLVSVYTGGVTASGSIDIRHYIDGKRVEFMQGARSAVIDTKTSDIPGARSRFRLGYDVKGDKGSVAVPVAVDEVRVIRAALSDAQIEALFRDNRLLADP